MAISKVHIDKPQRWDQPFDASMIDSESRQSVIRRTA